MVRRWRLIGYFPILYNPLATEQDARCANSLINELVLLLLLPLGMETVLRLKRCTRAVPINLPSPCHLSVTTLPPQPAPQTNNADSTVWVLPLTAPVPFHCVAWLGSAGLRERRSSGRAPWKLGVSSCAPASRSSLVTSDSLADPPAKA
jgi:hypothetical protein